MLALSGQPAHAAGSALVGEGLHISTGALVDPDGRTWVADHNGGFCRVTDATDTAAGQIEHPQRPGDRGLRTCLGGLLPDAGTGPDAAGQPVLVDPNPDWDGDEMALIPDGASPSSEVVRAKWNADTGLFEYHDTISMLADRGRPTVLSLGADDAVYVGFQRETTIQRIVDPAAEDYSVEIVGNTSDGRSAQLLAAGRDNNGDPVVYVNETTGMHVLRPVDGAVRPTEPAPFVVDPAVTSVGAMYYDLEDNYLYVGTADGANQVPPAGGSDTVMRIDPLTNEMAPYADGFSMVGGIAKAAEDELLVLDDPALLDEAEPLGTGRLFHVGLPAAHVTEGPLADEGKVSGADRNTNDVRPTFTISGEGAIECLLRGPGEDGDWERCGTDTATFTPDHDLKDGVYTLSVRATKDGITGKPEAFRFTVDTAAPLPPVIQRPVGDKPVSGSPWFEFLSEDHARYECAWGIEDTFTTCKPGRTRSFTEGGAKVLRLVAIDRAGNRSEPSEARHFVVDTALADDPGREWAAGPPSHVRSSALFSNGLHISTGSIVDPNHRTWVSDHNGGFCRVTDPDEHGAGTIEHPTVPGGAGERTCLGGLLPEAGTGPDAAGQPAFIDPTTDKPGSGDEFVLIPDGASPSAEVVRAKWNPGNGLFEYDGVISMTTARSRPTAVAIGPQNEAYVIFQRSTNVERINKPETENPTVEIVGTTAAGAEGIAVGRDAEKRPIVYLAEPTGITQLSPNAARPAPSQASPFAVGAADSPSALAYDLATGYLYAGTANATTAGADSVHRFDTKTGDAELGWLTGYSMIGGLFVRPDGVVYVHDDPALLDPAEPLGTGRLFYVGLPAAHIAENSKTNVGVERPAFVVTGEDTVQCRLRGPEGLDTGYATCDTKTPWTPAQNLADGDYTLSVRSVVFPAPVGQPEDTTGEQPAEGDTGEQPADPTAGEQPADPTAGEQPAETTPVAEPAAAAAAVEPVITGLVDVHKFTVDTVAPGKPRILTPVEGDRVGAAPWFTFEAEELASFVCLWSDQTAWESCKPGRTRIFDANGDYTLKIKAVDAAGNESVESEPRKFFARGAISEVRITDGPAEVTNDVNPSFRFESSTVDVEFACRLDNRAFSTCTSPKQLTGVSEGLHTFEVQGRDAAGNRSAMVKRAFRVDTTSPVISTPDLGEGSVTGPDVRFALAVSEEVTLECTIDGQATECGETVSLTGLTTGDHTFAVKATDKAGNVDTLTRGFTVVDAGAPAPAAPAPAPVAGIVRTAPVPAAARIAPAAATPATTDAAEEPAITVIDLSTAAPLSIRVADIDRRVDLARIQEAGVTVEVIPARGTKLIRFRIIKVSGNGRNRGGRAVAAAARTRRTVVATIYRRVKPGRTTITLTRRELRRVTAGKYLLEVTPGISKRQLGKAKTTAFTVSR